MDKSPSTNMKCVGFYRSGFGYEDPNYQVSSITESSLQNGFDLLSVKDLAKKKFRKNEIIDSLVEARADYMVVWRLDCLAPYFKSLDEIVSFLADLTRKGIEFISVQDEIDTDSVATDFLNKLNSAWVELKTNRKIENGRRCAIQTKLNGKKPGPRRIRDDQKIHQLREKGLSIRKIAKELNLSPALVHQALKKMSQQSIESENRLQT